MSVLVCVSTSALQACEVVSILQILIGIDIIRMLRRIANLGSRPGSCAWSTPTSCSPAHQDHNHIAAGTWVASFGRMAAEMTLPQRRHERKPADLSEMCERCALCEHHALVCRSGVSKEVGERLQRPL
jgi:hypothetical protein